MGRMGCRRDCIRAHEGYQPIQVIMLATWAGKPDSCIEFQGDNWDEKQTTEIICGRRCERRMKWTL